MEQLEEEEEYTQCPVCQSVWGMEEIDWQQCDSCGYPDGDGCLDEDWSDFDDDDDEDKELWKNCGIG